MSGGRGGRGGGGGGRGGGGSVGAFRMRAHLNIHCKRAVPHKGCGMAMGISQKK